MSLHNITVDVSLEEALRLENKGFTVPTTVKLSQQITDSKSIKFFKLASTKKLFGIQLMEGGRVELIKVEEMANGCMIVDILPFLKRLGIYPILEDEENER